MTLRPMEHPMLTSLCTERYGRLVAFGTMLTGDRNSAEDLVQEALVATFCKHRTFETLASAERYVRAAIATKYLDGARKEAKTLNSVSRLASRSSQIVEAVPSDSSHVVKILSGLPPRVRACVALRFLDDLSVRQTATLLNLSEGAVKRYVADGLKLLNAALGTDATVDDPPRRRLPVRSPVHE